MTRSSRRATSTKPRSHKSFFLLHESAAMSRPEQGSRSLLCSPLSRGRSLLQILFARPKRRRLVSFFRTSHKLKKCPSMTFSKSRLSHGTARNHSEELLLIRAWITVLNGWIREFLRPVPDLSTTGTLHSQRPKVYIGPLPLPTLSELFSRDLRRGATLGARLATAPAPSGSSGRGSKKWSRTSSRQWHVLLGQPFDDKTRCGCAVRSAPSGQFSQVQHRL